MSAARSSSYGGDSDQFSTMIDWYKLDSNFPGFVEARKLAKASTAPCRR